MRMNFAFGCLAVLLASATQAEAATTITVAVPNIGNFALIGSGTASVTYGGVVFSQSGLLSNGNFYNVSTGFSGQAPVVSSQQQSIGLANILMTLPDAASAITINYGTFGGSPVTFLLSSGALSVLNPTGSGYATPNVYSSGASLPFTSVQLTSPDSVLNISSISYTLAGAVPEPATWAMMIAGFGVIGGAMRYRRRSAKVSFA